jgi:hypothetical protein
MNPKGTAIVATVCNLSEASVIRSLLDSYRIPCEFTSWIPQNLYPVSIEGVTDIHIFVPLALEEEARTILEAHRRPDSTLRLVEDGESGWPEDEG